MAKAKLKYRNKAEKQAALDQADAQYNRALHSLTEQREVTGYDGAPEMESVYRKGQEKAYKKQPKISKLKVGGDAWRRENLKAWQFGSDKTNYRARQLDEAYQNRVNAIQQAGIAG